MKTSKKTYYLFLDVETTDTNYSETGIAKENKILEVAFLLTDRKLKKIAEDNFVIHHTKECLDKALSNSVREIHSKNNLLNEVVTSDYSIEYADSFISYLIEERLPANSKIILVGNTISFDYEAIRRHMPSLFKKLDYKTLDISAIRECISIIGAPFVIETLKQKKYIHRAMSDVRESYYELEQYLKLLESLALK